MYFHHTHARLLIRIRASIYVQFTMTSGLNESLFGIFYLVLSLTNTVYKIEIFPITIRITAVTAKATSTMALINSAGVNIFSLRSIFV